MNRRKKISIVVAVAALFGVSACGTRVPHDKVLAASEKTVTQSPGSTGGGDGVVSAAGASNAPISSAATTGAAVKSQTGTGSVGGTTTVGGGTVQSSGGQKSGGGGVGAAVAHGGAVAASAFPGIITATCRSTGSGVIKFGNIGPYTASGAGPTAGPGRDILNVWAAWVNSRGGICGHQVQVLTRDDQGSAAQTSAAVKDLVENQHVVAFIGNLAALTLSAQQSYIEAHHIPVIGGDLTNGVWFKSPYYFPQGAQDNEMLYRGFKATQSQPNGSKIAFLYCAEVVTCQQSYDTLTQKHIPEMAGSKIVYSKKVSITQISFAAECQAAKAAGAGTMLAGGDESFVERVANSCGQQGLTFAYLASGMSVGDTQKDNDYLNGHLFVPTQYQPWMVTNTPGSKAFAQAIGQFAPNLVKSGSSMGNWVSALVALQAVTMIGGGPVTPDSVENALHQIKNFTAGGTTGTLTYHSGAQTPLTCTGLATVQNHQFVAADGGNLSCHNGSSVPLPQ